MLILKVQLDDKEHIAVNTSNLKSNFSMIWCQLKVKFALSTTTLGAAIIAHGTMPGDVTYVPCNPAY